MTDLRRLLVVARVIEERFDAFRFGFKRRFGLLDPFEILPYRGHGTSRELFLKGRVLEETGITHAGRDDAVWRNVLNMAQALRERRSRRRAGEGLLRGFAGRDHGRRGGLLRGALPA